MNLIIKGLRKRIEDHQDTNPSTWNFSPQTFRKIRKGSDVVRPHSYIDLLASNKNDWHQSYNKPLTDTLNSDLAFVNFIVHFLWLINDMVDVGKVGQFFVASNFLRIDKVDKNFSSDFIKHSFIFPIFLNFHKILLSIVKFSQAKSRLVQFCKISSSFR